MKPVFQTIIDKDNGNCFQAALASLLELSLEEVPHFCNKKDVENGSWSEKLYTWLLSKNCFVFQWPAESFKKDCKILIRTNFPYLAVGEGYLGCNHCVIYQNGKMIHDPNPSGKGLKKAKWYELYVKLLK